MVYNQLKYSWQSLTLILEKLAAKKNRLKEFSDVSKNEIV
jgi:hypothetical protein